MRTISTVEHLIRKRDGKIGGMLLGDGTIIDTPPQHGETLKAMIKRGDKVRVEGAAHKSKRGRLHVHAQKIVMSNRNEDQQSADKNPQMTEEAGTVRKIIINRYGDASGFHLSNGIRVKTPTRHSEQLLAHVKPGDEVRVEGRRVYTTEGAVRFIAAKIHVIHSGKTLEHDSRSRTRSKNRLLDQEMRSQEEALLVELREVHRMIDNAIKRIEGVLRNNRRNG